MNTDVTLQALLDALLKDNLIPNIRIGPIKTAIKQYATILGYSSPARCPCDVYLKPDKIRNRIIEENAPEILGSHAVRNLKNNVSYILRKATELGIVSAIPAERLSSWKGSNKLLRPARNEHTTPEKYVLDAVPVSLRTEINAYEIWSTSISTRQRPKTLKKRRVTFENHCRTILLEAGYLVKFKGFNPVSIGLSTLIDPLNAINYIEWCIEQQGRFTMGAESNLSRIISIARYLELSCTSSEDVFRIQQQIRELRQFRAGLGTPTRVRDTEKRWLGINQLEMVGLSIYPLNSRRLKELSKSARFSVDRDLVNLLGTEPTRFRIYAFRVLQSLIIRFLIRIPLRQRNLREMLWAPTSLGEGQNLYKKDGRWRLRFRGDELKVSAVKGQPHNVVHDFPNELVELLEEWLHKWRPILIAGQSNLNKGKECQRNLQQYVFLNSRGTPLTCCQITRLVKSATFKFTGVCVNPHMFRNITATEIIKGTNNFEDAAYMLGDTVKTVIDRYAKLLDEDCGKRVGEWISSKLREDLQDTDGDSNRSLRPKLVYPRTR
jgi:hypothetical protein